MKDQHEFLGELLGYELLYNGLNLGKKLHLRSLRSVNLFFMLNKADFHHKKVGTELSFFVFD